MPHRQHSRKVSCPLLSTGLLFLHGNMYFSLSTEFCVLVRRWDLDCCVLVRGTRSYILPRDFLPDGKTPGVTDSWRQARYFRLKGEFRLSNYEKSFEIVWLWKVGGRTKIPIKYDVCMCIIIVLYGNKSHLCSLRTKVAKWSAAAP